MSVTSTVKSAIKAAVNAFKSAAETSAGDILDTLKKEHEEVKYRPIDHQDNLC